MTAQARASSARALLDAFGRTTGLTSPEHPPRRYLWTDAFAVCTWLGLDDPTGKGVYSALARKLVDQVHHVLGRHRSDDPHTGWLSGLSESEGERHPTAGGLRIGKPLAERSAAEPLDRELEWERDGQYYHYLTRWMHALARLSEVTGDTEYLRMALELARVTHAGFVARDDAGQPAGIHWKMSMDLSRALVHGMGAHDPLDGLVTYSELRHLAREQGQHGSRAEDLPDVTREIDDLALLCRGRVWLTDDPLGVGGLLMALHRMLVLGRAGDPVGGLAPEPVARAALRSLNAVMGRRSLEWPADHRLPFRELGLSLGLHALEAAMEDRGGIDADVQDELTRALEHRPRLADRIADYWLDRDHQRASTWTEHQDINTVMLAASLAPVGCLGGTPSRSAT